MRTGKQKMTHDAVDGIQLMLPIMGGLTLLMASLVGYIGNKLYEKLDEMSGSLRSIERELRTEINGIDRRVTRLESISKHKDSQFYIDDYEAY
jgi:hypothetical protein